MSVHLFREIEKLKKMILKLSAVVEDNLHNAVSSIGKHDVKLAHKVIQTDAQINSDEIDVEEECLKILALHQPVAGDLRFIVAVLKINSDLERIGDLAVNIAERAVALFSEKTIELPFDFTEMAEIASSMLCMSLDALVTMDGQMARTVRNLDSKVDDINRQMYDQVKMKISENPKNVGLMINLLSISRYLERIADHATNIAEDVIYMIEGHIVRHAKGHL
jgi:phosphate transport system protein